VVAAEGNNRGQCDVAEWRQIVAVAAGSSHTLGLCADGKVVATGDDKHHQCDVADWTSIQSLR
jgi:alpha-tubulin suppressor-like RCC1 family protein